MSIAVAMSICRALPACKVDPGVGGTKRVSHRGPDHNRHDHQQIVLCPSIAPLRQWPPAATTKTRCQEEPGYPENEARHSEGERSLAAPSSHHFAEPPDDPLRGTSPEAIKTRADDRSAQES
jgi:hypothetical protein